ncbi:MAG: hypothetical protein Unbinned3620contig1001_48 [Prokaryotic dsDNA virus sp.]|nr:MAG: hypothetical protein Unbinned3620contig1001_48 [Prokaryotic dsDNA virus sp.]
MPYKNAKQRIAMHINAPDVAKKWDKKYGGKPILGEDQRKRSVRRAAAIRAQQESMKA